MKNNVLKLIEYLYYFSLALLFILYLFPGSLIGYLLYGDLGKQPDIIDNPIGTSINHLFCFMYLTALAVICDLKQTQIFTNFYFIIFISVFLEASHYIIPNRAFEFYDLFANIAGVLMIFLLKKLIK
tara:strand:- start:6401 stop:6781 length:381 start_codon:yes stop_codon:yes gene_type:complete